jgi:hypothetical protein
MEANVYLMFVHIYITRHHDHKNHNINIFTAWKYQILRNRNLSEIILVAQTIVYFVFLNTETT